MSPARRNPRPILLRDTFLFEKKRNPIPYPFVLDALEACTPETRPMFGALAIYRGEKIVLILREKKEEAQDNGVWLATTVEHHQSLRHEFPHMRSITVLGKGITGWQILPAEAPDFEQAALRACELIAAGDPRIGKIPASRRRGSKVTNAAKPSKKAPLKRHRPH